MADETTRERIILELTVTDGTASGGGGKKVEEAKKEVDALKTSILGLQQANKKLREERKLLDTADEKQAKRIREINELIDKNDKIIKSNSSSLEKQRLNIGNYASALDKLVPGLGGAVQGIGGMTKASYAFIATGIGAIIAALGLALAALVSYFKSSGDGADQFAKITAQVSSVVNVLVDRVAAFARTLGAFFSGDYKAALNGLKSTFAGLGDEINREVRLAGELAEAIDALEDKEKDYEVALSFTKNQIKELLLQSKNRTLSEAERIKLLEKASKLEQESNKEINAIREQGLKNAVSAAEERANTQQRENESLLEYALRLTKIETLSDDLRDGVREAIKAQNEALGESIALQEKIQNQQDALEEKRLERERKAKEARENESGLGKFQLIVPEEEANSKKREDEIQGSFDEDITNADGKRIETTQATEDQLTEINRIASEARMEQEKKEREAFLLGQEQRLIAAGEFFDSLGQIAKNGTQEQKALALLAIGVDTAEAISALTKNSEKNPLNGITGGLAGALQFATGLARITKNMLTAKQLLGFAEGGKVDDHYSNVKAFAKGGLSGIKIMPWHGNPINRSNGDNLLATVKTGEVILNARQQAMLGGDKTFKAIGVPGFAGGGMVPNTSIAADFATREAQRNIDYDRKMQQAFERALAKLPNPVVTVEDINVVANNVDRIQNRAIVL